MRTRRPAPARPTAPLRKPDERTTPSYRDRAPLPLRELPPDDVTDRMFVNSHNSYVRRYTLGACSVIVTKEFGHWHLSIAHPSRYPAWDEIAEARYRLIPDGVTVALVLPPKSEYVNIHPNCFQLVEVETKGPL